MANSNPIVITEELALANNWVAYNDSTPIFKFNSRAQTQLGGVISGGVILNGTTVLTLPEGLFPSENRYVIMLAKVTLTGVFVAVNGVVDTEGALKVYGIPAPIDWLSLDNVGWLP